MGGEWCKVEYKSLCVSLLFHAVLCKPVIRNPLRQTFSWYLTTATLKQHAALPYETPGSSPCCSSISFLAKVACPATWDCHLAKTTMSKLLQVIHSFNWCYTSKQAKPWSCQIQSDSFQTTNKIMAIPPEVCRILQKMQIVLKLKNVSCYVLCFTSSTQQVISKICFFQYFYFILFKTFLIICFLHPVLMKDRCKLFCRVAGTTAYYQLKDRVTDGTPCGPDTYDICVQGLCRVYMSVSSVVQTHTYCTHSFIINISLLAMAPSHDIMICIMKSVSE